MNSGVSGTGTDTMHNEAAKSVFQKYPGIQIVSQYWSNWDAVQSKTNTLKALAANPDVDGIWSQDGEYGVVQALQQAGHKLIPVTGEMSNGYRNQLMTLHDKGLVRRLVRIRADGGRIRLQAGDGTADREDQGGATCRTTSSSPCPGCRRTRSRSATR